MNNGYLYQNETITENTKDLVHIKMLAAPINPADINQIQGNYPLVSPGSWHVGGNEGVGRVVAVSPSVTSINVGDLVIPSHGALGTWREQLFARASDLQVVPKTLSLEVAANLLVNPPTAYRLLRDFASLRPGDVIVQNGANSAVGRYVIQMAKLWGIRTVNVVRDRPKFEDLERELLDLGATTVVKAERLALPETLEYLRTLFPHKPILGLSCVGGLATMDLANCLADGAPLVTYGGMSRKNPIVTTSSLIFRDIRFVGFWMSRWYTQAKQNSVMMAERNKMMSEITEMFKDGKLTLPIFCKVPFATGWRSAIDYYTAPKEDMRDCKQMLIFDQI